MTQVLIGRATLEQLLVALEEVSDYINRYSIPAHQLELDPIDESIKTLNAALANAEHKAERERLANEPTGPLGVRTGPMEWRKP